MPRHIDTRVEFLQDFFRARRRHRLLRSPSRARYDRVHSTGRPPSPGTVSIPRLFIDLRSACLKAVRASSQGLDCPDESRYDTYTGASGVPAIEA
jgi:hypothetical protein